MTRSLTFALVALAACNPRSSDLIECPEGYVCEPEDTGDTGSPDDSRDSTDTSDSDTSDSDTDAPVPDNTRPSDDLGGDFCDRDLLSRQPVPGGAPFGPCVTQEVFCGQTIEGTTEGGSFFYADDPDGTTSPSNFDTMGCAAPLPDLRGPERGFVLKGIDPGYMGTRVTLDRECSDTLYLWQMMAEQVDGESQGGCPTDRADAGSVGRDGAWAVCGVPEAVLPEECSEVPQPPECSHEATLVGPLPLQVNSYPSPPNAGRVRDLTFVVRNMGPEVANFRLHVECY